MKKDFLIGIDGGGTKTAIVIADHQGNIAAQMKGPGTAITGIPGKRQLQTLTQLVQAACSKAGIGILNVAHCSIGLSGVDFPEEQREQLQHIAGAIGLPAERISLVNDGIIALWGASPEESCGIIQHGTDITSAWRSGYGKETLFDSLNVGAVCDMRKELISLTARMIDGRNPETPLKQTVLEHFGISDESIFCRAVYLQEIPENVVRSTAPLIYNAWMLNDPGAQSIIEKAVDDYVVMASSILARISEPGAVMILGGGMLNMAPARFLDAFSSKLRAKHPEVRTGTPELPPESGALLMSACKMGADIKDLWDKLKEGYSKKR